jgi:hypothetical protein
MCYWRSEIQRSGWRVPGPLNLDDEEDDDQILDDINGIDGVGALMNTSNTPGKNKQRFKNSSVSNPVGLPGGFP